MNDARITELRGLIQRTVDVRADEAIRKVGWLRSAKRMTDAGEREAGLRARMDVEAEVADWRAELDALTGMDNPLPAPRALRRARGLRWALILTGLACWYALAYVAYGWLHG